MKEKIIILYFFIVSQMIYSHETMTNQNFNQQFINVAKIGNPSVVSIISETITTNSDELFFRNDPFFRDFFPEYEYENKGMALGSGVIINKEKGYIVTNNHVIQNAESIKILLFDDREFEAEIVGTHEDTDLAVLKIEASNIEEAKMGDSDKLQVGEWVIAIGSPFGINLNHTVTSGIVSATGRSDIMSIRSFENFIQHDAAINPGNSGGALFNLDGEIIGINNAIVTDGWSRTNAGVGFAIPINQTKRIIKDLIELGEVQGAWLGITFQEITKNLASALELEDEKGIMITQVLKNSPAELAGLKEKDIIIEVDGNKINGTADLQNNIFLKYPGTLVTIKVIRDKKLIETKITLTKRPSDKELFGSYKTENADFDLLGLKIKISNNNIVVDEVKKGSSANNEKIKSGDIITQIDDDKIENIEDYYNVLSKITSGDIVIIGVTTINKRRNFSQTYSRYVAIQID